MRDELEEDDTGYWPRMLTGEGGGLCTAVNLNLPPNMIGRFVVCTGNNDEVSAITTPKELTMTYPTIVLDPNEYYSPPTLQSRASLKSVPTMQSSHSARTTSRLSLNSMKPIGVLRKSKRKTDEICIGRSIFVRGIKHSDELIRGLASYEQQSPTKAVSSILGIFGQE
jgi:hypothetical protein